MKQPDTPPTAPVAASAVDSSLLTASSDAIDRIGLDVFLTAIESTRGYVTRVLNQHALHGEIDAAMQEIRVVAWRRAESFDPKRGSFGQYAQGIAAKVVLATRREAAVQCERFTAEFDTDRPAAGSDPLDLLVHRFEQRRRIAWVRETVSERDWSVAIELMLTDDDRTGVAERLGVSPRTIRTARENIAAAAWTANAALRLADRGYPNTRQSAIECIPDTDGLRAIAYFQPDMLRDAEAVARITGLSKHRVHSRISHVRKLLLLSSRILDGKSV